jgi:hypothetical protein
MDRAISNHQIEVSYSDPILHLDVRRRALMQLIIMLFIALLIGPPTAAGADASNCGQTSELAAARVRWAAVRQSRVDTANNEKSCRAYGFHFYEAVTARQAFATCKDGIGRQPILDVIDSEIDAFNNLIAAQCGGLD